MTNASHQFKVLIERGEDGYFVARVPALPGCMTQAKTYEQLLRRVQEAIRLCLDVSGRVGSIVARVVYAVTSRGSSALRM